MQFLLLYISVVREIEVEDALQSNNSIKDLEQSILDQVPLKLLEETSKYDYINMSLRLADLRRNNFIVH